MWVPWVNPSIKTWPLDDFCSLSLLAGKIVQGRLLVSACGRGKGVYSSGGKGK